MHIAIKATSPVFGISGGLLGGFSGGFSGGLSGGGGGGSSSFFINKILVLLSSPTVNFIGSLSFLYPFGASISQR